MKLLIAFLLCSVAVVSGFAQVLKVNYFRNDGTEIPRPDSADYVRIISKPDSDSKLYNVSEFYANKASKLAGKASKFAIESISYEGATISYFKNGHRKAIINYSNGYPTDTAYYFYPNSKLYMITYYDSQSPRDSSTSVIGEGKIISQYDSLGHACITAGNGIYQGYNDDFKKIVETGPVKDGKRDGQWKGNELNGKLTFTEEYHEGELTSGTATDSSGNKYTYTKERKRAADYKGGMKEFYKFLIQHVESHLYGGRNGNVDNVLVNLKINKDGSVSNVMVSHSVSGGPDTKTIRTISLDRHWIPASVCGCAVDQYFSAPMQFNGYMRYEVHKY